MEIRNDLSTLQNTGAFRSITSTGDKAAVINTQDTVTSAEAAVSIIKKPVIRAEKTEETREAKAAAEVKEADAVKAEPVSSSVTGAESIPGPSAAIISAQLRKLEKTGIQFLEKRLIPIPFLKHKKIDADKAASILTSGNKGKISKLRVKAGNTAAVPLADLNDIGELSAFKGMGVIQAKEKDLSEFLGYAGKIGLEFKTDDAKNVGEYGAYNLLTTGWEIAGQTPKPVQLVREGVGIMTIKPSEKRSSQQLREEMEESWNAVEHINKMKSKKGILKALSKPLFDLSFIEKYRGWDQLDRYSDISLQKYNIILKHAQNKEEFDEIVDIMKNQGRDRNDNSEFHPDHTELIMKKAFSDDATLREKSEIVRTLKNQCPREIRDSSLAFSVKSFKLIQEKSGSGTEFRKRAKIYSNMISAMEIDSGIHFKSNTNGMAAPKKAFEFIIDQLRGDEDDAKAFIGLLKGSTVDEAKKRFQTFQTAVRTENMDTRIKVSHGLMGTTHFEEDYKTVLENLEPGENPDDLVNLAKNLRKYYEDDTLNMKKSFVEIKEVASRAGGSATECIEVLDAVSSKMDIAMDILKTVAKPVGNESFRAQVDLFKEMRSKYSKSGYSDSVTKEYDYKGLKDYSIIVDGKLQNETLGAATDRFKLIFDNLGGKEHIEEVRDSYIMVSQGMKEGGSVLSNELIQKALLNGKNKEEIGRILREGIKEAAKLSREDPARENGKIEQDEEKVVIGGVKLDKQKYDNLLRILDKKGE